MPSGPKNDLTAFQRAIEVILSSLKWQLLLLYLDDIVAFSNTTEQHSTDLRSVLTLLWNTNVTLCLKVLFLPEDHRLWEPYDTFQTAVNRGKTTKPYKSWRSRTTQTEARSFPGLNNLFERFVPRFLRLAIPLSRKLWKDQQKRFAD